MEKKAGIKAFEIYGYYNTVNSLAGGDLTKWYEIMAMPYSLVLTKLRLNKTESIYQDKYSKLRLKAIKNGKNEENG